MRAWQYSSTKNGIESNLAINPTAPLPKLKPDQHLIKVIAAALNPIDYKPAEIPGVGYFAITKPATPGIDFAGTIAKAAPGSAFKTGQLVFGVAGNSPLAGGALAEFCVSKPNCTVAIPDGVEPVDAATLGVASLTAYQSIVPHVKEGHRVFINGGSGGTGVFAIQISKAKGCHVTTTCSTANVDLCKNLGADVVVDYKKQSVLEALRSAEHKFDHAVDNVGKDKELLWHCHEFMQSGALYVMVGGEPTIASVTDGFKRKVLPSFLGGMKGKVEGFWPKPKVEDFQQIGTWVNNGTVKTVIDQRFSFEQAPQAFERLKTGRTKGKIVINVDPESHKKIST